MRVIHHRLADEEISEAAEFYEERIPGLGAEFLDEIEAAVKAIAAAPQCWPIIAQDVRRYLVRRFPYALIYVIQGDSILLLACKHHRRDLGAWRGRTGESP